jgi:DNA-binding transcriptional regulator YiaG
MTPFKSPFLVKCATAQVSQIVAKAQLRPTWLLDVRTVLGLSQAQMADLLGANCCRTYQRWEKRPHSMPVVPYRRAEALLEEANLTSQGKIRCA